MLEWLGFVKSLPVESEVTLSGSLVVDGVSVMGRYSDCFEASGFVDDGSVQDGIVESGVMFGRVVVFFGKCFWMCGTRGENNGDEFVVVVVMVPVSEGKFTLARDVKEELSEFGGSAVFSGDHAILG